MRSGQLEWGKGLLALVLGGLGVWATATLVPKLAVDDSLEQLFPEGSAAHERFEEFNRAFGTDDALLVVVTDASDEPVFNANCLGLLERLRESLDGDPDVEAVFSLATMEQLDLTVFGPVPRPFLPSEASTLTVDEVELLRADPLLQRGILSEDGRSTATWVLLDPQLRTRKDYLARAGQLADRLMQIDRGSAALDMYVVGFPLLQGAIQQSMWSDGRLLLIAAMVVMAAVAMLLGVKPRQVILAVCGWAIALGILAVLAVLLEHGLHLFSTVMLPLLLVVSGSSIVHLGLAVTRFGRRDPRVRRTLTACLASTVTTAIGFGTLTLSELAPLARLGGELVLGTVLAFAFPAALLLWAGTDRRRDGLRGAGVGSATGADARLATGSDAVPTAGTRARMSAPFRVVRRLGLLVGLACLPWFLFWPAHTGSMGDFLGYLPEEHPQVVGIERAREDFGGLNAFEIVVQLPRDGAEAFLTDPDSYAVLEDFEHRVVEVAAGEIPYALGPVTLIAYLNTRLDAENDFTVSTAAAEYAIDSFVRPYLERSTDGGVFQKLYDYIAQLLSRDGTRLRFGCRIPHMDPQAVSALKHRLSEQVFEDFQQRLQLDAGAIHATGYSVLVSEAVQETRRSQRDSLLWGGLALALILIVVGRDPRVWLPALATNAAAVLGMINLLRLTGIEANLYTTILAATLLAVIVDDTLHFLLAYRRHRGRARDASQAAFAEVRHTILASSICLMVGVGVFAWSALPAYRQFALAAAVGIVLALFWDWFVLPALLARVDRRAAQSGHESESVGTLDT